MTIHLVLIDALNLIRRVHSAQPDPNNIEQTIQSTSKILNTLFKGFKPSHALAVFDGNRGKNNWRHELYPAYKSKRKPMPEALLNGLESIQQAWWELGLDSLVPAEDEADDLIATLAHKIGERGQKVTIISTDKGYCQLLMPTVQIRDYFQQRWLNTEFVDKEFGVKVHQLTDYWGLTGISSSSVTGVPGIGPKAALEILTEFNDLESAHQSTTLAPKYRKKFDEHYQTALVCKQISGLKTNLSLGFNLQDLRYPSNL